MIRVLTAYLEKYSYPAKCVSCGQPAGSRNLTISKSKSSGKYQHKSLYMSFPICDTDADIQESFDKRLKPLNMTNSIVSLAFIVVVGLVLRFLNDQPNLKTPGIILAALLVIIFIVTTFFRMRIMNENKEKTAAYKKVLGSVKLAGFAAPSLVNKKGVVKLDFEDAGYANEFAQMNEGVLPGK